MGHDSFIPVHLMDELEMVFLQSLCTKPLSIKAVQVFHDFSTHEVTIRFRRLLPILLEALTHTNDVVDTVPDRFIKFNDVGVGCPDLKVDFRTAGLL